ncbi:MAG: MBL fold metallo-hydrolase [Bacteroidetes bacterium]|nr:MAG: MBL fold metallo-hydrolase [Bacteroidota bacterium]
MKLKATILLLTLTLCWSCKSTIEEHIDLNNQRWIHGSENCKDNIDKPIQVVRYNNNTWILRQNKCTNYEAPFMFLYFGDDKALLMDTGATKEASIFPLYETVKEIIDDWSENNGAVELIVAHTHKHGDHYAGDDQFKGKPNTTVINLEVDDVASFFNISNWPENIVDFDLGNRLLQIIPIPGHQASSIAVYDTFTKILLTGDTFYPGRLYIKDWSTFKLSIDRLVTFTNNNKVSTILGNHIEMTQTPGVDYPIETLYQPKEHQLPLNVIDLKELSSALTKLGDKPAKQIHDSFIIYPVD